MAPCELLHRQHDHPEKPKNSAPVADQRSESTPSLKWQEHFNAEVRKVGA